jgi:hypothetical protein
MNKQIVVSIQGGAVADVHGVPEGTEVVIRDYDVPDDCDGMETDEDGNTFQEFVFESKKDS